MKTILLIIVISIIALKFSLAQDTIVKKTGSLIICHVEGEYSDHIRYRKTGHSNGSVFSIWNNQIVMVKYEDGRKTIISEKELASQNKLFDRIDTLQPLSASKAFGGIKIKQGNRSLSSADVKRLFINHDEARVKYSRGKRLNALGNILGIPCGFAFGWQVGTAMAGGKTNGTVLLGSGIGFLTGFLLNLSGKGTIIQSVNLYNSDIQDKTAGQLSLKLTENRIGLCYSF